MKRDLEFVSERGTLGKALGVAPEHAAELDVFVGEMVDRNCTLRQVVEALNARGDLTDAEWTTAIYALGWFQRGQEKR